MAAITTTHTIIHRVLIVATIIFAARIKIYPSIITKSTPK